MMRKLIVVAMVAGLVGMGGLVRDAQAGATVDLLFVGVNGVIIPGTNTVAVNPGDTLKMGLFMRNDSPLTAAAFAIGYDTDGDNELEILSAVAWGGVVSGPKGQKFQPLGAQFTTQTETLISPSTNAIGAPPSVPLPNFGGAFAAAEPAGYNVGTISFRVLGGVNTDGTDLLGGINIQNIIGQAFLTPVNINISSAVQFNGAAVNLIPEPGTAALLGLGLAGIAAVGRRRSRP